MKLTDLDAEWMRYDNDGRQWHVATMAEANGIWFLCPHCQLRRDGGEKVHVHGVLCWNHSVPAGVSPGPGRWTMTGTGFEDLTLYPSVDLSDSGVCRWHGGIKNGQAT